MSSPRGCVACGREVHEDDRDWKRLFCWDCLPTNTTRYVETITLPTIVDVPPIRRVGDDRTDLGAYGTEENPRVVEIDPGSALEFIDAREGERVNIRRRATVALKAKVWLDGEKEPYLVVKVTLKDWHRKTQQWTDRLYIVNRKTKAYLEVYTRSGTIDVLWTSGWQPLKLHTHGGARPEEEALPADVRVPIWSNRELDPAPEELRQQ